MKIMCVKIGGMLTPVDDQAKDHLRKIAQGELVWAEYEKNRNLINHRRYFAFVNETFQHQDLFMNVEIWRKYLQCLAGHFDEQILPGGKRFYVPRSIAWDELDEIEFQNVFTEAIDAYIAWYEKRVGPLEHEHKMRIMGFL